MAGHRRTRKPGTPTARRRHHDNAKNLLLTRLAGTTDPVERLAHGYDYVRAAAARATRRAPDRDLTAVLDTTLQALMTAGDRLIS
jgi:hypothetical protein